MNVELHNLLTGRFVTGRTNSQPGTSKSRGGCIGGLRGIVPRTSTRDRTGAGAGAWRMLRRMWRNWKTKNARWSFNRLPLPGRLRMQTEKRKKILRLQRRKMLRQMSEKEKQQLYNAVHEIVGEAAQTFGHTCNLITNEVLIVWPNRLMRKLIKTVTEGDATEARAAANVVAAKALENLEAKWLTGEISKAEHANSQMVLETLIDPVTVAIINIWFSSEQARDGLARVQRALRASEKKRRAAK